MPEDNYHLLLMCDTDTEINGDNINIESEANDIEEENVFQKPFFKRNKLTLKCSVSVFLLVLITCIMVVIIYNFSSNTEKYPSYPEIKRFLSTSSGEMFPDDKATIDTIGSSVEGVPIQVLDIRSHLWNGDTNGTSCSSPLIWIVCGVHAREWTSPLTCLHFISQLANIFKAGGDEGIMFRKFRYRILPVANPDGYKYTFSSNPLMRVHRKNRRKLGCDTNDGVDLNRNFPTGFVRMRSVCSDTYPGPEPFSEPETQAIRDAFQKDEPWLYFSVHGNGNAWMYPYPYAYSPKQSNSWESNKDVVDEVERKIHYKFSAEYRHGQASAIYGTTGGTMFDWVYEKLHVKRSFVLELKYVCDIPYESNSWSTEEKICEYQPPIENTKAIKEEAWFGFKELVKASYTQDC